MSQLPSHPWYQRLPLPAWIALLALVGGILAFAVYPTRIPTDAALSIVPGLLMIAAMIFGPQALVVFLFAQRDRIARQAGIVLALILAAIGIAAAAFWLVGGTVENLPRYDATSFWLLAPSMVIGAGDLIAGLAAWVTLPPKPTVRPPAISAG